MKNRQKRHAHSKRRCNATQHTPVSLRLCLTIFGHCNDSISTLTKSNMAIGNSIRCYLVDLSQFKVKLKAEFQGSNRDMYRPKAVVVSGSGD